MTRTWFLGGLLCSMCATATASNEALLSGYLCCNMHSDGKSISDLNADDGDQHVIAVGTPITLTAYKKHRAKVVIENHNQALVNDSSRDLSMQSFAKRYIVPDDPREKIKTFPKNIQYAISGGHLIKGMTREQVLMSVGYPVSSDVPNLNTRQWTLWITDKVQFHVIFDDKDLLADVENAIDARTKLLTE